MENNEFRGMNDGIILYILKSGDRHTDELKELIDSLFFEIKVGTLYSVITRLKNQKYINEYRSSSDGSRRKYFSLTDLGKKHFDKEFSEKFVNAPTVDTRTARIVQQPISKKDPKPVTNKKQQLFEEYVNNISRDEFNSPIGDIDFSNITDFNSFNITDKPTTTETTTTTDKPTTTDTTTTDTSTDDTTTTTTDVEVEVRDTIVEVPVNVTNSVNPYVPISDTKDDKPRKREIDYDSVNDTSFEYKSVLNSLFPKKNTVDFNVYQPYTDDTTTTTADTTTTNVTTSTTTTATTTTTDFDDIYTFAERDGISIRTSTDTNRYQGSKILNNLLRFHTSVIWYAFIIIEYLLLSLFFSGSVEFNGGIFGKICLFTAVVPVISIIVYLVNTRYTIKDLPRFKDVLEIALIVTISAIIIVIALSAILSIDYSNVTEIFNNILTPCLLAINVPIFFVIKYFLARLDFYQTI